MQTWTRTGNALDLTGAWVFFQELVQIGEAADSYVAKITTDARDH